MSKKNSKSRALKQHQAKLDRNAGREQKMEAKMKEVQEREASPEVEDGEWEDVEDQMDTERAEEVGTIKNEIPGKKIKKDKFKLKIFQKRVLEQEKKRNRKVRKAGVVVYKKAMHTE
jgi:hypothetical protein